MTAALDHLVVVAATLDEGVAWCERTLGITPGPGGQHALMGTHNRLFSIATPDFPLAYFEIIAVDPTAPAPQRQRWFDMDDAALQERVRRNGPQLVHWAARVDDAPAGLAALQTYGYDRGEVLAASRPTPQGLLQWQITVRPDGQRLCEGLLPTLIQWGEVHPAARMPASAVTLVSVELQHPQAETLQAALQAIGLNLAVRAGPVQLRVQLQTPGGLTNICS